LTSAGLSTSYNIKNCKGKSGIEKGLPSLVRVGMRRICAAVDIDNSNEQSVYNQYESILGNGFPAPTQFMPGVFRVARSIVSVIPVGITDGSLQALGTTVKALDDYPMKTILTNDSLLQTLSQNRINSSQDFERLLHEVTRVLNSFGIRFQSSKSYLLLSRAIFEHHISPATFVSILFASAGGPLTATSRPLVERLRQFSAL